MDLFYMAHGLADPHLRQDPHIASKPWYYGTIMTFYSFFSLVRSTFTYTWVVEIPTDKNQPWISRHDCGLAQLILNSIGLLAGLISIVLIMYRIREHKIERASAIATGFSFVQFACTVGALITFFVSHPWNSGREFYSQGFAAGVVSAVLSLIAGILFLLDCTLLRFVQKAYSGHQRKLVFSFFAALWYVIIGGFLFEYLENWSYEESAQFVIVTLLTIGYGNFSPSSDVTKIILIIYASFGMVIIGFFVIAIGDAIVEKAERQIQFQQIMNRRKRLLKKGRGEENDRTPTPLKQYPYGTLHSLPTFTRPYFNIPDDDIPASLYDRYLDPEIPLHPHSTPTYSPRHKYSSIRDDRFRKVQGQLEHHRYHHAGHDARHEELSGHAGTRQTPRNDTPKITLTPLRKCVQDDSFSSPPSRLNEFLSPKKIPSLTPLPLHLDAPTSVWRRELPNEWLDADECAVPGTESEDSTEEMKEVSCSAKGSIELDSLSAPSDTSMTRSLDVSIDMDSVEDLRVQRVQDLRLQDPNLFTSPQLLPSDAASTSSLHVDSRLEFWLVTKVLIWILAWWICSSVIFTLLEEGWTLVDGLYFTFETMTTIGYGDLSLRSPLSWEFWYLFIFNGVSIVAFCFEGAGHDLGYRVNRLCRGYYLDRLERKARKRREEGF